MTALTLATEPNDSGRAVRPLPWRRMVLVTWLQHRGTLTGAAALFGAVTLYLGIMGLIIHHAWDASAACHPASSPACQELANRFSENWHNGATIAFPLQLLPALIGAFVGAPVLAREMETGSFRYAWTQGFGRTRWTVAKMALIGASLAVIAGAFGVLANWYFGPLVADGQLTRLDPRIFEPSPARDHPVVELPAAEPLLTVPGDRGRRAARAGGAADRRDHLAGPPQGRLRSALA
jgi:hypothetical protein